MRLFFVTLLLGTNLLLSVSLCEIQAQDRFRSPDRFRAQDRLQEPDVPRVQQPLQVPMPPEFVELQKLCEAGRWDDGKTIATRLVANNPQQPWTHFWLGYVELRRHDAMAAIRSLRKSQVLGLREPTVAKTLGLAYYSIHQFTLFQEQMKKAIQDAPRDAWPHYYLGLYEVNVTENFELASKYLSQALSLGADDAKIHYYHGYCAEIRGDSQLARQDYETAIRLLARSGLVFSLPYQRLAILLAETEPALALQNAQMAVAMEPKLASNHVTLAKLLENEGKLAEAIEKLKMAVRLDLTLASPYYRLHRLYLKLGERDAAAKAMDSFQTLAKLYGS